jgi:Ca2+-binding RTX toxin-like protein
LAGDGGNDVLIGGGGDDVLSGGYGDDEMTGGSGADLFTFNHEGLGEADMVTDFAVGVDTLDLINTGIESWDDLFDARDGDYMEQVGNSVVIHTTDFDSITLLQTQMASLSQSDFWF